jgi:hypothetical protein
MLIRNFAGVIFSAAVLFTAHVASAQDRDSSAGTEAGRTTLSIGYDYSYLSYQETQYGRVLDKDYGSLNGIYLSLRHDTQDNFVRASMTYRATDSATYSGSVINTSTMAVTPYSSATSERFFNCEAAYGFITSMSDDAAVSPYFGLGYWDWLRGMNSLPDYQEDYHWWYGTVGISFSRRFAPWQFGFDGAILFPFDGRMTTNTGGMTDTFNFNIKPQPGVRIEILIQYEVSQDRTGRKFIFCTPYYQRWDIGASDWIPYTVNGVQQTVGGSPIVVHEPDSTTDIYGFRLGVGFVF